MIPYWIISAFAIYRIARMISQEDGPFDIFTKFRTKLGQGDWIGRGAHCFYCIVFWLGIIFNPFDWVEGLAAAGLAIIIFKVEGKLNAK